MTNEELQTVVAAVIQSLKTNGKTIDQLTPVTSIANSDSLEVSGGKKIAFSKLKELVASAVVVTEESIKSWVVIESTDALPVEPTTEEQMKAYVLADKSTLYVYVGEGGDTLGGSYQSVIMKGADGKTGPKGDSGVSLGEVVLVNDLTTGGEGNALSAEMGKVLNEKLESQVIYDVTANNSGATFDSLSALLSNENLSTLIPSEVRCGGMSIRFVQSYDNKYVQCRLKSQTFSTTESDWELSASIDELEELRDSILGAESVSTDITASSTYYTTNAFIAEDGTLTLSSVYKCTTKPYFLKRGHTIKFKGKNANNRILAYTTQQSVAVGDTVTLLPTTHTEGYYHIYTADVDRNIIISYTTVTSVIDVSPAVEGALVEIENKIESLHGDIDAVEGEVDEVETRINDINNEINGNGGIIDISHIHRAPDNLHAFIDNNGLIQLSSVNYTTQPYLLKSGHAIWVKGSAGSNKTLLASTTQQSVAIGDTVTPLSTIYHEGGYWTYINNGDDMLVVVNSVYNQAAPAPTIIKDVSDYIGGLIDKTLTSYASSSIPAIGNLDVAYPNYDYCHIITYGQSFSEGGGGVGKYDVIPGNYMVGNYVQITNKSNRTYLSGLRSDRNGAIAAQCTNAFSLLWRKYHNTNTKFIASAGGHGGATLLEISKGTTYYSQFLDELNAAKTIADNESKSIGCIAILFIQGESGAGTGYDTKSDYIYLINKLKEDMQSDIMSIYGQAAKPVFITYQTGYKWIKNKPNGPIPTAQLEYAMDNEDVILGCPSYFAAFTNTNHPSGNGYSMIGELMSKYLYGVMTDRRIQSVYPYSIKAEGHCIDIMCNVTVPPLQIDIHTVSQVPNYGFKVYVNNLTATISDIKVIGNMIRLIVNEDLTGKMVQVSYAIDNDTNGRGNICDSDDKYMSYQTYGEELSSETMQDYPVDINGRTLYGKRLPLQNWLSNFYKNVRFGFIRHCVRAKTTDASFANKLTNELGLEVIYTSSNSSVATVGSNGALTFAGTGYSVITASVTFDSVTYTDDYLLLVEQ